MAVYQVRVSGSLIGQLHENVLFFQKPDATNDTPQQLAIELRDSFIQFLRPLVPNGQFTFTNIEVRDVANPQLAAFNLPINISGSGFAFTGLTPFMCYSFRKRTLVAGKKGRGRMYFGAVNQANIANGLIVAANLTGVNSQLVQIMARYGPSGTSGFTLGLWGPKAEPGFTTVTSLTCDNVPRVQRRRNIGHGM